MIAAAHQPRFFFMRVRLSRAAWIAGSALGLGELAAVWGKWRAFGLTLTALGVCYLFNSYARIRRVQPSVHGFVNGCTLVLSAYFSGWSIASWLFLTHLALVLDVAGHAVGDESASVDPGRTKLAMWTVALTCAVQDVAAVLDGVSVLHALSFTALVWFCIEISRAHLGGVREILARAEGQRAELESAHLALHDAHVGLSQEIEANERIQDELRQAQRLEAVGRLAAGVAHEINTPVQFVSDSLHFVRDAMNDLLPLLEQYKTAVRVAEHTPLGVAGLKAVVATEQRVDLDYVVENAPPAIERALDGLGRIATIVRSLKEFAHPDTGKMSEVDLNKAVQSTLNIAKHEYKLIAELETDFAALPPVMCYLGELNQVVLNIVVNASHAIDDVVKRTGKRGSLRVRTVIEDEDVVISITDSGGGIPVEIRERIFDPFFTTKGVGKGTGQGLAIARSVIDKHGGRLTFECDMGVGTTFLIRLPLHRAAAAPLLAVG